MMTPVADVVEELFASLDFELPCESRPGCEKPAFAALACRFCPFAFFACDGHLARLRFLSDLATEIGCRECKTFRPTLDELVVITPVHS